MNNVEALILENMQTTLFHNVVEDDFSFVDGLIDDRDLNRIISQEVIKDGYND